MMKTRVNGTVRPEMDAGLRRGVAAAVVLLIVCVLAVGAVSADEVRVSSFDELQNNISTSGDRTIIVSASFPITSQLTIRSGNITLTTNNADRTLSRDGFTGNLFRVNSGGKLTITGFGTSNLTLDGMQISSANSLVYVSGGSFTLADGGILANNTASSDGGGVYVNAGTFTMSGGEISNNKAKDNGGGVYVNAGTFTMSGGTISGNTIYNTRDGSCGGGVYVGNGEFTMSGTAKISSNTAYTGGGVYLNGGTLTMSGGEISKNKASNGGGGVYVKDGMFTMSGGTISNNDYEATSGGGVYVGSGGTFTMSGGTITNHMVRYGGGVYVGSGGTFTMSGTAKISSNTADIGGGVNMYGGTFTMSGGTISNNKANEWWGGGVYGTDGSTFMMESGTISDNTATSGGGVYLNRGTFEMESGTISGNTANGDGGGVYVNYDGEFEMSSGTISDNTASEGGGVYVIGIFELLGSSSVDSVYLTSDKVINVTGELTGTGPQVTDINLQSPVHGTKVVTISPSVPEPNYLNYFQLNASLERFELEYLSPDIVLMNTYTVSFDTQGGSTVPAQTVSHGEMVNKPADPTKDGFTFTNWYNESACLNLWDFTTPVTKDLTLYAKWTPNEPGPEPPSGSSGDGNMENAYRVLFNDGATTLYVVTDLSAGDKLTKPEDPVKDGYTFAGWHKDSACTQAWDFNDGITGDMTLYAKWTAIEATPTATATATATAVTTPQPTATQTTAAATSVPQATTAAAVSPTLVQTPAPVAGALLGLLAAGLLLRRRLQ